MSKEGWISVARAQAALGQPQPCQICFFSFELSHAHHLMPLAEQYDRGFDKPNHTHAWLCPNHHALIHFLLRNGVRENPGNVHHCMLIRLPHTNAETY